MDVFVYIFLEAEHRGKIFYYPVPLVELQVAFQIQVGLVFFYGGCVYGSLPVNLVKDRITHIRFLRGRQLYGPGHSVQRTKQHD